MRAFVNLLCALLILAGAVSPSFAAGYVGIVDQNNAQSGISTNPLYVQGSFAAGGFTPSATGARMTPLSVTTGDSSGTLPTGTVDVISNVGSNPMYCNTNGIAATTADELIPANSWYAFTIPAAVTTLHCIATGGSTTANGLGGAGLPTGSNAGSGSGGGGAVTLASGAVASGAYASGSIADGAEVTLGTKADAATCATTNTGMACFRQLHADLIAGLTATGAAVPANAGYAGGNAVSSEPSKATTGNLTGIELDLAGKQVTSPYANRENMARGFATETGTSAGTILAASGSASLKEYVTGIECYNTSATTDTVTINDGASTKLINPAAGGNNQVYEVPLVAAANTAVTFTATTGESTEGCAAQGFYGY